MLIIFISKSPVGRYPAVGLFVARYDSAIVSYLVIKRRHAMEATPHHYLNLASRWGSCDRSFLTEKERSAMTAKNARQDASKAKVYPHAGGVSVLPRLSLPSSGLQYYERNQ